MELLSSDEMISSQWSSITINNNKNKWRHVRPVGLLVLKSRDPMTSVEVTASTITPRGRHGTTSPDCLSSRIDIHTHAAACDLDLRDLGNDQRTPSTATRLYRVWRAELKPFSSQSADRDSHRRHAVLLHHGRRRRWYRSSTE